MWHFNNYTVRCDCPCIDSCEPKASSQCERWHLTWPARVCTVLHCTMYSTRICDLLLATCPNFKISRLFVVPYFHLSKPSGYYMYHKLYVLPKQCNYVFLYGPQNKQRLFPYTTLTDWFL